MFALRIREFLLGFFAVTAFCGCHLETIHSSLSPSLHPIDIARPIVIFRQVKGEACGPDAVVGAIQDMKRLDSVDGYLEVVVKEKNSWFMRCASVTAHPFRYGNDTDLPNINSQEINYPLKVPGRP